MKKRLAMLCMAGIMIFSMSACGSKKTQDDTAGTVDSAGSTENTDGTEQGNTGNDSSQAAGNPSAAETDRVSDRADYVGIEDLEIASYVTLADYKNMKVQVQKPATDDESIENYINSKLLVGSITDRAVEKGDVADIDFVGKKDGVAFQGGTGQGYKLEIGSGAFIPGFEDGLIGVMPGDTVDLNLTFPENYSGSAELAGQAVVFTVTVNGIDATAEYATVTVEEMERMGLSYASKDELWKAGKQAVEENAQKEYQENIKSAIVQKLLEESVISSVPEYLVEEEIQNYSIYMENVAKNSYGVDLETFVTNMFRITMEQYNEQLNEMCEDTIRQFLVIEAVARAEGIDVTEDMVNEKAGIQAVGYGFASPEEFINEVGYSTFRMSLVQEKVLERLMETVAVENAKE